MKLMTGILALALTAGTAWSQNPAIIQNTKDALNGAQQKQAAASNAALGTTPAKPSGAVPARSSAATPAKAPAIVPAKASAQSAPAMVPAKAPVKAAAAPAKATAPAMVPAKAPVKAATAPAKATATAPAQAAAKPQDKKQTATKTQSPMAPKAAKKPELKVAAKPEVKAAAKAAASTPKPASSEAEAVNPDKPTEDKKYSMTGKRDPFISPVVNRQGGSGCSTGKKCLDIEQIALHGVVKSDNGMIAVVTNGLNKAYFLRENDPVFNGYVVKITVDSSVFKETLQDRLGKPFTKDVVKRILTPAV
jgi:Tfp pilus assembly protein PilP